MAWPLEVSGQELFFSYAQKKSRIRTSQVTDGIKASHGFSLLSFWQVDSGKMLGHGIQVAA
jgi:hypothetical protein